jgi:hypothetical protein
MNRQPHRLPRTGKPALKTSTTNLVTQAESGISNFDLPALNSMRRTASPSRPYGRYAVGLRPSPDPDAYFDAPNQDKEVRRINQNDTAVGLDRPRSFRNELHLLAKRRHFSGASVREIMHPLYDHGVHDQLLGRFAAPT